MRNRRVRRETAAVWTSSNPVLPRGASGIETDTEKMKVGDGSTAWNDLDYVAGVGGGGASWGSITGTLSAQTDLQLELDGKQASGSYAAASHTHAQADVTNLVSDLAGKAATSHTHALTDSYVGEIAAAANQDYTLDLRVPLAREVTEFSIITDSGTCTAALKNGANIIVGSVSVTSTISTQTGGDLDATHKSLATNGKLVLTLSANSAALRVQFCVKYSAVTGAIS